MKICFPVFAVLLGCACGHTSQPGPIRRYPVTGKIVSVDTAHHVAMIDASAIPNFMEAMTMEYPVPAPADLDKLKAGENISATLNVYADDHYTLSAVQAGGEPRK